MATTLKGPVQALLDAVDGTAWLAAPDGTLVGYGRPNWDAFADANGNEALQEPANLVDANLYDAMTAGAVRDTYRELMQRILDGSEARIGFRFRCDSPGRVRDMHLAMTPVRLEPDTSCVLYQCVLLESRDRPPLGLFDFSRIVEELDAPPRLPAGPIVLMCSFCQRVKWTDPPDEPTWIEADAYYRRGGAADVGISHGLCPDCHERIMAPRRKPA